MDEWHNSMEQSSNLLALKGSIEKGSLWKEEGIVRFQIHTSHRAPVCMNLLGHVRGMTRL